MLFLNALVLYVGKTTGPLESRMGGYLRPHATQRNVRNNQSLLQMLRQGQAIDIYGWADPGMHRIGDFHLNYAAGFEDSIIKPVEPPWNDAKSAQPTKTSPQFSEPAPPESDAVTTANQAMLACPATHEGESALASELLAMEHAGVIKASPIFDVMLGKTYYHHGFFNVPVKFSNEFPEHGTEISIYCGDPRTLIRATVDRKANQTNHTPRIYGRGSLTIWFRLYKRLVLAGGCLYS